MVETVHDLRSATNDYNDMIFTAKSGSSFFFPSGNLLLCDRKYESDQNPGQINPTQVNPSYFPMESLGEDVQCERTYSLIQKHVCFWLDVTCIWRPKLARIPDIHSSRIISWEDMRLY